MRLRREKRSGTAPVALFTAGHFSTKPDTKYFPTAGPKFPALDTHNWKASLPFTQPREHHSTSTYFAMASFTIARVDIASRAEQSRVLPCFLLVSYLHRNGLLPGVRRTISSGFKLQSGASLQLTSDVGHVLLDREVIEHLADMAHPDTDHLLRSVVSFGALPPGAYLSEAHARASLTLSPVCRLRRGCSGASPSATEMNESSALRSPSWTTT